jgi:hypothetical protein
LGRNRTRKKCSGEDQRIFHVTKVYKYVTKRRWLNRAQCMSRAQAET